jgi:hypothetical protein
MTRGHAFGLAHQRARLRAGMPLANARREAYTKIARQTAGVPYQIRTTPPVLRFHERVIAIAVVLLVVCGGVWGLR